MKLVSRRGIFYLRMKVTQNDLPSVGSGDDGEDEEEEENQAKKPTGVQQKWRQAQLNPLPLLLAVKFGDK